MKLKIGIGLQVVVLVGIIIAIILPWYEIKNKNTEVTVDYKWKEVTCKDKDGDKYSAKYEDASLSDRAKVMACMASAFVNPFDMDDVVKVLNSCLSFLVIAGAVCLGTALLQIILLVSPKLCRSCIWKLLTIGCAIAGVVMLFISFFTLLRIPKSFEEDANGLELFCNDRWCDKIIGSDDDFRWIPGGGWWACLAACFTAFCAGIFTLASNR